MAEGGALQDAPNGGEVPVGVSVLLGRDANQDPAERAPLDLLGREPNPGDAQTVQGGLQLCEREPGVHQGTQDHVSATAAKQSK